MFVCMLCKSQEFRDYPAIKDGCSSARELHQPTLPRHVWPPEDRTNLQLSVEASRPADHNALPGKEIAQSNYR